MFILARAGGCRVHLSVLRGSLVSFWFDALIRGRNLCVRVHLRSWGLFGSVEVAVGFHSGTQLVYSCSLGSFGCAYVSFCSLGRIYGVIGLIPVR